MYRIYPLGFRTYSFVVRSRNKDYYGVRYKNLYWGDYLLHTWKVEIVAEQEEHDRHMDNFGGLG